MTRILVAIVLASIALVAQAPSTNLGYTDTPMLPGLAYHVHDPARPRPAIVTPAARVGDAPSDATVLFNGTDLSAWTPSKQAWKVENGYFEVIPNSGDLRTKERFGDVQLSQIHERSHRITCIFSPLVSDCGFRGTRAMMPVFF